MTAGAASFAPHQDIGTSAGTVPGLVAVADFTGDAIPDVAVARKDTVLGRAFLDVYPGRPDGTFAPRVTTTFIYYPESMVAGDFDGDGVQDLMVERPVGGETAWMMRGNGNGTFTNTQQTSTGPVAAFMASGDFDGNGKLDVVTSGAGFCRALPNNGTGALSVAALPMACGGGAVAVADVDGDGFDDVLSLDPAGGRLTILRGGGDGSLSRATSVPAGTGPAALAVADLDADGVPDVVVADSGDRAVAVLHGLGSGAFAAPVSYPVGASPDAVAVGDFNDDGVQDVAVANAAGSSVSVLEGHGDGTLGPAQSFPAPASGAAIAAVSFDTGPMQDLVIASGDPVDQLSTLVNAAPATSNELVNPGAESTLGGPLAGWTVSGMTTFAYGTVGGYPDLLTGMALNGGSRFFDGGSDPRSTATQTVQIGDRAAAVDAGRVTALLSAQLGGFRLQQDAATLDASFRDEAGQQLGVLEIGPVTPAQRHARTVLLDRRAQTPVPAGTRNILVTLASTRVDGGFADGYADDLALRLAIAAPPPPPSGSGSRAGGRLTLDRLAVTPKRFAVLAARRSGHAAAGHRRRALPRGSHIHFRLSAAAKTTIAVEHAVRGVRRGGRCVAAHAAARKARPCTRQVVVTRLRIAGRAGANVSAFTGRVGRRSLVPGSYRLVATAIDAAGTHTTKAATAGFTIVAAP
jgi:hypothetical protein